MGEGETTKLGDGHTALKMRLPLAAATWINIIVLFMMSPHYHRQQKRHVD